MKQKMLAGVFLAGLAFFLAGCAGAFSGYGRLAPNEQVGRDLESGNPPAGYQYYYSGPDAMPNAILGIADGYTLDTRVWKPVDLTPKQLHEWMQWITRNYGTSLRYRGADVLDSSGKKVGIWYSPAWNTVVQVKGDQVVVHLPSVDSMDKRKGPFNMM